MRSQHKNETNTLQKRHPKISFVKLLSFLIISTCAIQILVFAIPGRAEEILSYNTLIMIIISTLMQVIFLNIKYVKMFPLVFILAFNDWMYFNLRLLVLSSFPESFKYYVYTMPLYMQDYENTYFLFVIYSLSAYLALWVADKIINIFVVSEGNQERKKPIDWYLPRRITIVGTFSVIMLLAFSVFSLFSGISGRLGFEKGFSIAGLLLSANIDVLVVFALLCMRIEFKSKMNRNEKIITITVFICYVLLTLQTGHRSGIYELFVLFIVGIAAINRKIGLTVRPLNFMIFIFLFIVALELFNAATYVRRETRFKYAGEVISIGEIKNVLEKYLIYEKPLNIKDTILNASKRVSLIDPLIVIVSKNYRGKDISNYINVTYTYQRIINKIFPGNYYPVKMGSENVFSLSVRGYTWETLLRLHQGDLFSIYGICFVMFGWVGGLFSVLIIFFLVAILYNKMSVLSLKYYYIINTYFLYMYYYLLQNFGFDNFLVRVRNTLIALLFYLFIVKIVSNFVKGLDESSKINTQSYNAS